MASVRLRGNRTWRALGALVRFVFGVIVLGTLLVEWFGSSLLWGIVTGVGGKCSVSLLFKVVEYRSFPQLHTEETGRGGEREEDRDREGKEGTET